MDRGPVLTPAAAPEARVAVAFPAFRPRFPWYGGDLQTLRNYLFPRRTDLSPWPAERVEMPLGDATGDRLLGALHDGREAGGAAPPPLVVLVHGLTGCEDSFYVRRSAAALLAAGHAVLRLNLRGAGPSRAVCTGHYCAGSSADVAAALRALVSARDFGRLVLVGFSLGGNIVLKMLGEGGHGLPVIAAAAVSVPFDLAATARRMMAPRNAPYHRWLLARMKAEATGGAARTTAAERTAIAAARSVYAFDDAFVAPRNGFAGADEYYARCSARRFVAAIDVPTLAIQARDDPWIPATAFAAVDWGDCASVRPLFAASGGHVGFHGRGGAVPWHDRCLLAFLQRIRDGGSAC